MSSGGEQQARRTQAERSEATRAALIAAARELFAARGYAAVGTEEIVRGAGVTRGALYHHFNGKRDLFRACYEQIEAELAQRLAEVADPETGAVATLRAGKELFLDATVDPEIQRIVLIDAPAVLGWEEWREIGARYGLGLIEALLGAGMESGEIRRQPVRPLAHAILGALDEVAMLVARSERPEAMRAEASETLESLLAGLQV